MALADTGFCTISTIANLVIFCYNNSKYVKNYQWADIFSQLMQNRCTQMIYIDEQYDLPSDADSRASASKVIWNKVSLVSIIEY